MLCSLCSVRHQRRHTLFVFIVSFVSWWIQSEKFPKATNHFLMELPCRRRHIVLNLSKQVKYEINAKNLWIDSVQFNLCIFVCILNGDGKSIILISGGSFCASFMANGSGKSSKVTSHHEHEKYSVLFMLKIRTSFRWSRPSIFNALFIHSFHSIVYICSCRVCEVWIKHNSVFLVFLFYATKKLCIYKFLRKFLSSNEWFILQTKEYKISAEKYWFWLDCC